MSARLETRDGKIVYDIRTLGPDGAPARERRALPEILRGAANRKRWLDARERHLALHGRAEEPAPEIPTLREFGLRWVKEYARAEGLKPSTIDGYQRHLRLHIYQALGSCRLNEIREPEIQQLKLSLEGKAAKTRNAILSTLDNVLRTAVRWGELATAPRIDKPRVAVPAIDFYEFDDWERLRAGARAAGPMQLCMVLLAGDAGLRRGELIALEQRDIGPTHLEVARSEWRGKVGTPKGGRSRRIPMSEQLRAAVTAVRHLRGKRLLWQTNGRKVRVTTLQSWLEAATRHAGLPESRHLHKLRHTFCSHLAMKGAPAVTIKELAGHADLGTTLRYMHLSRGSKEAAIALLDRRNASQGAGGEQAKAGEAT